MAFHDVLGGVAVAAHDLHAFQGDALGVSVTFSLRIDASWGEHHTRRPRVRTRSPARSIAASSNCTPKPLPFTSTASIPPAPAARARRASGLGGRLEGS